MMAPLFKGCGLGEPVIDRSTSRVVFHEVTPSHTNVFAIVVLIERGDAAELRVFPPKFDSELFYGGNFHFGTPIKVTSDPNLDAT